MPVLRENISIFSSTGVSSHKTFSSDCIHLMDEKDEYGNIIQESKSLTSTDFEHIISAIYDSGVIDNTVEKTVITKVILSKCFAPGNKKLLIECVSEDMKDFVDTVYEVAKEMGYTALKTNIAVLNRPYDNEYLNKMKIIAVLKIPFLKPFAKVPNGTCFQALTINTTAAE